MEWRRFVNFVLGVALVGGCATGGRSDGEERDRDGAVRDGSSSEECAPPRQMCGSRCVNLQSDADNCGECGNACRSGAFCSEGECARQCSGGREECGSSCVDLSSDPDHCGVCDNSCPDDRVCKGGSCVCDDDLSDCDGACVSTDTSFKNCGLCGRMCETGEHCVEGSCRKLNETDCLDGVDNDEDGMTDCEDSDCAGVMRDCQGADACEEGAETCREDGTWSGCEGCAPPPECTSSSECDYGYRCSGGSCVFDRGASWDIVVVDGVVPPQNLSGGAWDPFGGRPDPTVVVRVRNLDGPRGQSTVVKNTLEPRWDQNVLLDMSGGDIKDMLRFDMYDSDFDADDFIGACVYRGTSSSHFGGHLVELRCPRNEDTNNSGFRLRFRIVPP